jgi:hypothetical protein
MTHDQFAIKCDAGHFALDEKNDDIASLVLAFMAKHSV